MTAHRASKLTVIGTAVSSVMSMGTLAIVWNVSTILHRFDAAAVGAVSVRDMEQYSALSTAKDWKPANIAEIHRQHQADAAATLLSRAIP